MTDITPQQFKIDLVDSATFSQKFGDAAGYFTVVGRWGDPDCVYAIATMRNELAGYVRMEETPTSLFISYLEVAKKHQGVKISGCLLSSVFAHAGQKNKSIVLSPYTSEGLERLQRQISRLKDCHPHIMLVNEEYC